MTGTEIELEVGPGPSRGEYTVRVVNAAAGGEPQATFALDIDDMLDERRQLEDSVLASAARARRNVPEAEKPLKRVGQQLFEALFSGPVAGTYRASLAVARERSTRLRVVLRLTAPDLSMVPWEALYDPEIAAYLCRREPLVRHIPALYTPQPLAIQPPLRVLGLVASPDGLAQLDVEAEQRNLGAALSGSSAAGKVHLEWLQQASWSAVHERLLTGKWHVLHFIGHGDYDRVSDQGRLALVGEEGRTEWVEASRLVDLLDEAEPTPRLVVLNSCASGRGGTRDLFSGTAAALVRSGISAVAAMQFSVSDRAAVAFPRGFYTALAAGRTVDEAVRSGRIAFLGAPHTLEWVTPVLYVRGGATRLFTFTEDDHEEERAVSHGSVTEDPRWADALSAYWSGRWGDAVEQLQLLSTYYPDDDHLRERLDEAVRRQQLAGWWEQAEAAAQHGEWARAVDALARIVAVDEDDDDARTRLAEARAAHHRQSLLDEMAALHETGRWEAVIAAAKELEGLGVEPEAYGDLLADARRELTEARLEERYAQGLQLLDGEKWQEAADLLSTVEEERPGYRDTTQLIDTALEMLRPPPSSSAAAPAATDTTASATEAESSQPSAAPADAVGAATDSGAGRPLPSVTTFSVQRRVVVIALNADGTVLGIGGRRRVDAWDVRTHGRRWTTVAVGWRHVIHDLAVSPDGSALTTVDDDGVVRVWIGRSGEESRKVDQGGWLPDVRRADRPAAVAVSSDGSSLVTADHNGVARVWDIASGKRVQEIRGAPGRAAVALNGDGSWLATAEDDGVVKLWDVASGSRTADIRPAQRATAVAMSADKSRLATVGEDRIARVWDVSSGDQLQAIRHTAPVNGVALSATGDHLATAGDDRFARIWTIADLRDAGVATVPGGTDRQ